MRSISNFLTSRWGPILTGIVVGVLAPVLVKLGNPGNMGICVACFNRDIAGALGFHRAATVQYIRPEIIGFVLGALIAALLFREFKPRGGSSPLIRFLLGMFAMIGALVFLGCPWRAYLRLGGGDWNAIPGILGLFAGIGLGIVFLKRGFSLGRSRPASAAVGWVMPVFVVILLILLVVAPLFGRDADGNPVGPIFFSEKGPGSQHAPLLIALVAGLLIGFLAQRSRFCTVGAFGMLSSCATCTSSTACWLWWLRRSSPTWRSDNSRLALRNNPSPTRTCSGISAAWSGWTGVHPGGRMPGRQVFLSGEGDGDASIFVFGMLAGAGVAHTFSLASSPTGPGAYGPAAVIAGLVILSVIGLTMRETRSA